MDLDLAERVAVVTGASKGIGMAVTRALVNEGARVVAGAREPSPELTELVAAPQTRFLSVDLTTQDGPARLVNEAVSTFGGLDIVVNNVGAVHPRFGGLSVVSDDDWTTALTINFLAAVRTTRAALPHLVDRGGGSIVTISSVNAFLPDPTIIDYCAAKAALSNFSKALSKEVGGQGIRVNTVSPGPVATELWLGDNGVAATVAQASGGDPSSVAKAGGRRSGDRSLYESTGGRRSCVGPGQQSRRERHRRRLRHRRRADHHLVSGNQSVPAWRTTPHVCRFRLPTRPHSTDPRRNA